MKGGPVTYKTIDEYIAMFPGEVQEKLQKLRETIQKAAPGAKEKISYQMPAFDLKGTLVYFAAFKDHFGFFPTSSGVEVFKEELKEFQTSRGTIRFPLDQPLPLDLVEKIVKFRVAENLQKAERIAKKKPVS